MSKLKRDEVLKLAFLCRLNLSDEEIESLSGELSQILDYVHQLDGVDTNGLKPTYQVTGLTNQMREDEPIKYDAQPDKIIALAPESKDHQYKVKRVLE